MRYTTPENDRPIATHTIVHLSAVEKLCSVVLRCSTPRSSASSAATSAKKPIQNQIILTCPRELEGCPQAWGVASARRVCITMGRESGRVDDGAGLRGHRALTR